MDFGSDRHIVNFENNITRSSRLLLHMEIDITADHHGRELFDGGVFRFDGADILAFTKNRAAISHFHDLVQLVGDEENGFALSGKILHDLHELGNLLRGENGSRLVKNKDFIIAVEHFENLGSLLHTDSNVFNDCVRIDMEAILF